MVLTSGLMGRMALVEWCVDGQSLGELGCDGVIVATSTGSTAYNLSAGGPVLAWGLDGFVVSFVSPHSLHARSMVLGPAAPGRAAQPLGGRAAAGDRGRPPGGRGRPGGRFVVRMGTPSRGSRGSSDASFFTRYRQTFSG